MKLLVSVRDVQEARLAVDAEVDIVDVKEPNAGALGRADDNVIKNISSSLGGRATLSVALGELADIVDEDRSIFGDLLEGIAYCKIALANMADEPWQAKVRELIKSLPGSTQLVVVSYVDHFNCSSPTPDEVIQFAIDFSLPLMLFDTFEKKQNSLFDLATVDTVSRWIEQLRESEIDVAIAGSIGQKHLPDVLICNPDVVGVRGAVCRQRRNQSIDRKSLNDFISQFRFANVPEEL